MKTLSKTIFFLTICLSSFGQTKEEINIRKIIEAEHFAFHSNPDRKIYMSFWSVKPETRWVLTGPNGLSFMTGDDLIVGMSKNMYPPTDNAKFAFSNFVVKASGIVGWANYDVKVDKIDGKILYSHEFRCLEKINNVWKIISGSVHEYE